MLPTQQIKMSAMYVPITIHVAFGGEELWPHWRLAWLKLHVRAQAMSSGTRMWFLFSSRHFQAVQLAIACTTFNNVDCLILCMLRLCLWQILASLPSLLHGSTKHLLAVDDMMMSSATYVCRFNQCLIWGLPFNVTWHFNVSIERTWSQPLPTSPLMHTFHVVSLSHS